jgi:hypothetical protein
MVADMTKDEYIEMFKKVDPLHFIVMIAEKYVKNIACFSNNNFYLEDIQK